MRVKGTPRASALDCARPEAAAAGTGAGHRTSSRPRGGQVRQAASRVSSARQSPRSLRPPGRREGLVMDASIRSRRPPGGACARRRPGAAKVPRSGTDRSGPQRPDARLAREPRYKSAAWPVAASQPIPAVTAGPTAEHGRTHTQAQFRAFPPPETKLRTLTASRHFLHRPWLTAVAARAYPPRATRDPREPR